MPGETPALEFNPYSRRLHADPYPAYRALRRYDPVCRLPNGTYFVSRYRDLVDILRDPERFGRHADARL